MPAERPPRPDDGPALKWQGGDKPALHPDLVQVQATPGTIALLLGTRDAASGARARLERRIALAPEMAKQLANALKEVVRIHEAREGNLDATPAGRPVGAFTAADVPSGARTLFERVQTLKVGFGFEKSFKLAQGSLLEDRLILGVRSALAEPAALLEACRGIGMPRPYLEDFARELAEANTVGFGFEGGKRGGVYKVYLEFWDRLRERVRRDPADRTPALLFLGFKWEAASGEQGAVARYTCHPLLSVHGIARRLEALYDERRDAPSLRATRAILELASQRIGDDSFVYVEAEEEGNPRRSYDLNLYKAGLRVGALRPSLSALCRDYGIAEAELERLETRVGARAFGHLSGGLGRDGRDFLTVYYELEAL